MDKPEYKDRKCKVYLLHGDMTDEEMSGLYHHPKIKAYITLTHGEGFGLPIFEAFQAGFPFVSPDWAAPMIFLFPPANPKTKKKKTPPPLLFIFSLIPIQKRRLGEGEGNSNQILSGHLHDKVVIK